ncbi:hypothetical protein ACERK3_13995 [Phycisphaerales bacterium AB-hyl4]|uniref:Uncharacterized protein n=1 Tax=Natronomicrosphaera hydrolytica TaxID=3242702 RepID=A0ABV4U730_9BACT
MAVSIREIRPHDLDAVIAAVQKAGGEIDRSRVVTSLSLVICVEGAGGDEATADPPGAVLCVRGDHGEMILNVAFADDAPEAALVSDLVGKAMSKVRSAAVHACRVNMLGELPAGSDPLSTGSNWYDRFVRDHAA